MSYKPIAKKVAKVSHTLDEILWHDFLTALETNTNPYNAKDGNQSESTVPLLLDVIDSDAAASNFIVDPNEVTETLTNLWSASTVNALKANNISNDNDLEVVVLSSDSESENDNNMWSNRKKAKYYQQLWEQTRYLVFHRSIPNYAWAHVRDLSELQTKPCPIIEDGSLFPYNKLKALSDQLQKFVTDCTLNSKELHFLWNNVIQWIIAIKISSDPLDLNFDDKFNLILVEFMVQYMNYKLQLQCHLTNSDDILISVNQIMHTLSVIFNGNNIHILMVLLRIELKHEYRHLLDPIFRKYLTDRSLCFVSDDFVVYLRLIFCFKRWKMITPLKSDREKINEIAVGKSIRESVLRSENTIRCTSTEQRFEFESILPRAVPKVNIQNQAFISISDLIGFAIERKAIGTRILLVYTSLDLDEAILKYFRLYEKYITRKKVSVSPTQLSCMNLNTNETFLRNHMISINCTKRNNTEKAGALSRLHQQRQNGGVTPNGKHLNTTSDNKKLSNSSKISDKKKGDIKYNSKKSDSVSVIEINSTDDDDVEISNKISTNNYLNKQNSIRESVKNQSIMLENTNSNKECLQNAIQNENRKGNESFEIPNNISETINPNKQYQQSAIKNIVRKGDESDRSQIFETSRNSTDLLRKDSHNIDNITDGTIVLNLTSDEDNERASLLSKNKNLKKHNIFKNYKQISPTTKQRNNNNAEMNITNITSRCRTLLEKVPTKPTRKEKHCILGEVSSTTSLDNAGDDQEFLNGKTKALPTDSLEVHSAGSYQHGREVGIVKAVDEILAPCEGVIVSGTYKPGSLLLGIDYSDLSSENEDNESALRPCTNWKVVEEATSSTEIFSRSQSMDNVIFSAPPLTTLRKKETVNPTCLFNGKDREHQQTEKLNKCIKICNHTQKIIEKKPNEEYSANTLLLNNIQTDPPICSRYIIKERRNEHINTGNRITNDEYQLLENEINEPSMEINTEDYIANASLLINDKTISKYIGKEKMSDHIIEHKQQTQIKTTCINEEYQIFEGETDAIFVTEKKVLHKVLKNNSGRNSEKNIQIYVPYNSHNKEENFARKATSENLVKNVELQILNETENSHTSEECATNMNVELMKPKNKENQTSEKEIKENNISNKSSLDYGSEGQAFNPHVENNNRSENKSTDLAEDINFNNTNRKTMKKICNTNDKIMVCSRSFIGKSSEEKKIEIKTHKLLHSAVHDLKLEAEKLNLKKNKKENNSLNKAETNVNIEKKNEPVEKIETEENIPYVDVTVLNTVVSHGENCTKTISEKENFNMLSSINNCFPLESNTKNLENKKSGNSEKNEPEKKIEAVANDAIRNKVLPFDVEEKTSLVVATNYNNDKRRSTEKVYIHMSHILNTNIRLETDKQNDSENNVVIEKGKTESDSIKKFQIPKESILANIGLKPSLNTAIENYVKSKNTEEEYFTVSHSLITKIRPETNKQNEAENNIGIEEEKTESYSVKNVEISKESLLVNTDLKTILDTSIENNVERKNTEDNYFTMSHCLNTNKRSETSECENNVDIVEEKPKSDSVKNLEMPIEPLPVNTNLKTSLDTGVKSIIKRRNIEDEYYNMQSRLNEDIRLESNKQTKDNETYNKKESENNVIVEEKAKSDSHTNFKIPEKAEIINIASKTCLNRLIENNVRKDAENEYFTISQSLKTDIRSEINEQNEKKETVMKNESESNVEIEDLKTVSNSDKKFNVSKESLSVGIDIMSSLNTEIENNTKKNCIENEYLESSLITNIISMANEQNEIKSTNSTSENIYIEGKKTESESDKNIKDTLSVDFEVRTSLEAGDDNDSIVKSNEKEYIKNAYDLTTVLHFVNEQNLENEQRGKNAEYELKNISMTAEEETEAVLSENSETPKQLLLVGNEELSPKENTRKNCGYELKNISMNAEGNSESFLSENSETMKQLLSVENEEISPKENDVSFKFKKQINKDDIIVKMCKSRDVMLTKQKYESKNDETIVAIKNTKSNATNENSNFCKSTKESETSNNYCRKKGATLFKNETEYCKRTEKNSVAKGFSNTSNEHKIAELITASNIGGYQKTENVRENITNAFTNSDSVENEKSCQQFEYENLKNDNDYATITHSDKDNNAASFITEQIQTICEQYTILEKKPFVEFGVKEKNQFHSMQDKIESGKEKISNNIVTDIENVLSMDEIKKRKLWKIRINRRMGQCSDMSKGFSLCDRANKFLGETSSIPMSKKTAKEKKAIKKSLDAIICNGLKTSELCSERKTYFNEKEKEKMVELSSTSNMEIHSNADSKDPNTNITSKEAKECLQQHVPLNYNPEEILAVAALINMQNNVAEEKAQILKKDKIDKTLILKSSMKKSPKNSVQRSVRFKNDTFPDSEKDSEKKSANRLKTQERKLKGVKKSVVRNIKKRLLEINEKFKREQIVSESTCTVELARSEAMHNTTALPVHLTASTKDVNKDNSIAVDLKSAMIVSDKQANKIGSAFSEMNQIKHSDSNVKTVNVNGTNIKLKFKPQTKSKSNKSEQLETQIPESTNFTHRNLKKGLVNNLVSSNKQPFVKIKRIKLPYQLHNSAVVPKEGNLIIPGETIKTEPTEEENKNNPAITALKDYNTYNSFHTSSSKSNKTHKEIILRPSEVILTEEIINIQAMAQKGVEAAQCRTKQDRQNKNKARVLFIHKQKQEQQLHEESTNKTFDKLSLNLGGEKIHSDLLQNLTPVSVKECEISPSHENEIKVTEVLEDNVSDENSKLDLDETTDNITEVVLAELKLLSPESLISQSSHSQQNEINEQVLNDTNSITDVVQDQIQQKLSQEQKTAQLLDSAIEQVFGNSSFIKNGDITNLSFSKNDKESPCNKSEHDCRQLINSPGKGRIDVLTAERINSTFDRIHKSVTLERRKHETIDEINTKNAESKKTGDDKSKKNTNIAKLHDVKIISADVPEALFADDESENSNSDELPITREYYFKPKILSLDFETFNGKDNYRFPNSVDSTKKQCLKSQNFTVGLEVAASGKTEIMPEKSKAVELPECNTEDLSTTFEDSAVTVGFSDIPIDLINFCNLPKSSNCDAFDEMLMSQYQQSIDYMISGKFTHTGYKTSTAEEIGKECKILKNAEKEAIPKLTETKTQSSDSNRNILNIGQDNFLGAINALDEVEVPTTIGLDLVHVTVENFWENDGDLFPFPELDKTQSRSNSFSNDSDSCTERINANVENSGEKANESISQQKKSIVYDHSYNKDITNVEHKSIKCSSKSLPLQAETTTSSTTSFKCNSNNSPTKDTSISSITPQKLISPSSSNALKNTYTKVKCYPTPFWITKKNDSAKTTLLNRNITDSINGSYQCSMDVNKDQIKSALELELTYCNNNASIPRSSIAANVTMSNLRENEKVNIIDNTDILQSSQINELNKHKDAEHQTNEKKYISHNDDDRNTSVKAPVQPIENTNMVTISPSIPLTFESSTRVQSETNLLEQVAVNSKEKNIQSIITMQQMQVTTPNLDRKHLIPNTKTIQPPAALKSNINNLPATEISAEINTALKCSSPSSSDALNTSTKLISYPMPFGKTRKTDSEKTLAPNRKILDGFDTKSQYSIDVSKNQPEILTNSILGNGRSSVYNMPELDSTSLSLIHKMNEEPDNTKMNVMDNTIGLETSQINNLVQSNIPERHINTNLYISQNNDDRTKPTKTNVEPIEITDIVTISPSIPSTFQSIIRIQSQTNRLERVDTVINQQNATFSNRALDIIDSVAVGNNKNSLHSTDTVRQVRESTPTLDEPLKDAEDCLNSSPDLQTHLAYKRESTTEFEEPQKKKYLTPNSSTTLTNNDIFDMLKKEELLTKCKTKNALNENVSENNFKLTEIAESTLENKLNNSSKISDDVLQFSVSLETKSSTKTNSMTSLTPDDNTQTEVSVESKKEISKQTKRSASSSYLINDYKITKSNHVSDSKSGSDPVLNKIQVMKCLTAGRNKISNIKMHLKSYEACKNATDTETTSLKRHSIKSLPTSQPPLATKILSSHSAQSSSRFQPYSTITDSSMNNMNSKNFSECKKHFKGTVLSAASLSNVGETQDSHKQTQTTNSLSSTSFDVSNIKLSQSMENSLAKKLEEFRRTLPTAKTYKEHRRNQRLLQLEDEKLRLKFYHDQKLIDAQHLKRKSNLGTTYDSQIHNQSSSQYLLKNQTIINSRQSSQNKQYHSQQK